MRSSISDKREWASEGELNPVGEPERILRYQIRHMSVCDEWVDDTKPGGTAGVLLLSLQNVVVGDEGIFLFLKSPQPDETGVPHCQ